MQGEERNRQGGNLQGDVERATFDPLDRYSMVLQQQGRLQLAADSNEQVAIHHHFLRTLIVDIKGPSWRPGNGFDIGFSPDGRRIEIQKGRFYIDGILCENDATRGHEEQPHSPVWTQTKSLEDLLKGGEPFGFYLDCWERHVTWLNDPRLREVALGGPDTTTRLQIAWQVVPLSFEAARNELDVVVEALSRAEDAAARKSAVEGKRGKVSGPATNTNVEGGLEAALGAFDDAPPRLAAEAKRPNVDLDPCVIAADAEYRGRENQLYRVEVHRPGVAGAGKATFKWSRENGSVVFKVLDIESDAGAKTTRVTLESLGRDRRTQLGEGDWVELTDDGIEMRREAPALLKVAKIDAQRRLVTLEGIGTAHPTQHAILRRWDHRADPEAEGAVIIKESTDPTGWIELERGFRIRFSPGGRYRTGDHWLIPARVATGDVEWPKDGDVPRPLEPHGVKHHRALLAILVRKANQWEVVNQKLKP